MAKNGLLAFLFHNMAFMAASVLNQPLRVLWTESGGPELLDRHHNGSLEKPDHCKISLPSEVHKV